MGQKEKEPIHQRNEPKKRSGRRKLFGGYGREPRVEILKPVVTQDEKLEQLKRLWIEFRPIQFPDTYETALERLKNHDYSAKDIEQFSIVLGGFQDEKDFAQKAGDFLSALINTGKETDYTINTASFDFIWGLGYKNKGKNITIIGDGGNNVGGKMESGNILVKGNVRSNLGMGMIGGNILVEGDAHSNVGYSMDGGKLMILGRAESLAGYEMKSGKIIIMKGCGDDAATEMKGGILIIYGHAGKLIAGGMDGGELYLNCEYEALANELYISGGKIYHNGKLIFNGANHL